MNFKPELAAKVLEGSKTVTRRLPSDNPRSPWWRERCSLQVGRAYAVCPGRGKHAVGRVRILDVSLEPLHPLLPDVEAEREGFDSPEAFADGWERINGARPSGEMVWRIEFEVVSPAEPRPRGVAHNQKGST